MTQVSDSVRAHLHVIADLEQAVRDNWVDRIPAVESSLAEARELSDNAVWRYRAHVASTHARTRTEEESANTSVTV